METARSGLAVIREDKANLDAATFSCPDLERFRNRCAGQSATGRAAVTAPGARGLPADPPAPAALLRGPAELNTCRIPPLTVRKEVCVFAPVMQ